MLVHAGLAVHFIFALWYLRYGIWIRVTPEEAKKRIKDVGGPHNLIQFLTVWILFLQAYFYAISTVNDLINISFVQALLDYVFAALVFPCSIFVTVMFWTLVRIDPKAIFEGNLNDVLPSWFNHSVHTMPAISAVLEVLSYPHVYPSSMSGITTLQIFAATYITCCFYSNTLSGTWAYPFLNKLSMPKRTLFFAASHLVLAIFYHCGNLINYIVWGLLFS
ncbi:unnamed protein product [Meganyctiphanes norvegica]|uniref:Uncharacterized protein n=1 Tax=Meganyctiphanes norvegica TaxID=48144 RepID=A0AAV2RF10_MEGNR